MDLEKFTPAKKGILSVLLITLLNFSSYSQATLVANNDSPTRIINGIIGGHAVNVLNNDTINGLPATSNTVTLNMISTTGPLTLNIATGNVSVNPGTPAGNYMLRYGMCEIQYPTNCQSAVVFITVCDLPAPIVSSTTPPGCSLSAPQGSVTLTGLPSGNWRINGNGGISISGSGSSHTISNLGYNIYNFTVSDSGCTSPSVYVSALQNSNGISLTGTADYDDFNGDGSINEGDLMHFHFSVTNTGTCPLEDIEIRSGGLGYSFAGGPIASLMPGATDSTTITGTHALNQYDLLYQDDFGHFDVSGKIEGTIVASDVDYFIPNTLGVSDGIKLVAFTDTNGNGTQDTGEPIFTQGWFSYEVNNDGINHRIFSATGIQFLYETNPSTPYTLSYSVYANSPNGCVAQYTSNPSSYTNVTVAAGSGITTYYFPITVVPCTDAAVSVSPAARNPNPGFAHQLRIRYTNYGNQSIPSGTVTFTKDSNLTIDSVSQYSTLTATGFTYNFTNLVPNISREIIVSLNVPPIPVVNLGDLTTSTASISIPPNDSNVSNNYASLTQTITSAYDPNNKSENHGGKIVHSAFTTNDYLTYTINFENTGNSNAINIRVTDTLDARLDENSVSMVSSNSRLYSLERVGNVLTWKFDGINLPPATPASTTIGHGYVIFQVKPKPGFAIGDIISNTANIYFDFNPAIVTEPCLTEFVQSLGNEAFTFNEFECYPNPAGNYLNLSNGTAMDTVEITSVLGQMVKSIKINDLQAQIDLNGLYNGIYFVKVTSGGRQKTVKIIKE